MRLAATLIRAVRVHVHARQSAGSAGDFVTEEFRQHLRREALGCGVSVQTTRQAGDPVAACDDRAQVMADDNGCDADLGVDFRE